MKKRIFALLLILFLMGCTEFQINDSIKTVGSKINPYETNCYEWANNLIPTYLILSTEHKELVDNLWLNNKPINVDVLGLGVFYNCFRQGSKEGENINYFYLSSDCSLISYSERVISEEGVILGERGFSLNPVLELYGNLKVNLSAEILAMNPFGVPTRTRVVFEWRGFDDIMKEVFKSEELKIKAIVRSLRGSKVVCKESYDEESGIFVCEYDAQPDAFIIKLDPSISDQRVYKIIEENIVSCEYIEGKALE